MIYNWYLKSVLISLITTTLTSSFFYIKNKQSQNNFNNRLKILEKEELKLLNEIISLKRNIVHISLTNINSAESYRLLLKQIELINIKINKLPNSNENTNEEKDTENNDKYEDAEESEKSEEAEEAEEAEEEEEAEEAEEDIDEKDLEEDYESCNLTDIDTNN